MSRARSRRSPITGAHRGRRCHSRRRCDSAGAGNPRRDPGRLQGVAGAPQGACHDQIRRRRSISRRPESWHGTMHNVLVTGGSRGIGLAISRRIAAAGYHVIAVARRESDELRDGYRAKRGSRRRRPSLQSVRFERDRRHPGLCQGTARRIRRDLWSRQQCRHRHRGAPRDHAQFARSRRLLRLNVLSPVILTKYVVRHMMADGAGRIINMSSIIASTGYNGLSVYGATKAAATGFTRVVGARGRQTRHHRERDRARFYRYRIDAELSNDQRKRIASRSALRRLPEAEDVARMVEYLLGDGGRNITGSVMTIDAGNTA